MAWSKEKKLSVAIGLSFVFCCVEVFGGYIAHSLAIMSDAAHLMTDIMGFAITLGAIVVSKWGASAEYSFGFKRAEILGALGSILVIWILTGWLLIEAFGRLYDYHKGSMEEIDGKLMSGVALFGICTNLCIALVFSDEHGEGFSFHSHDHGHSHGHSEGHEHSHGHGEHSCSGSHHAEVELAATTSVTARSSSKKHGAGHDHDHSHGHDAAHADHVECDGGHDHNHDHGHGHGHGHGQDHHEHSEATGMLHGTASRRSATGTNNYGAVPSVDDDCNHMPTTATGSVAPAVIDSHAVHDRDVNMEAAYMHVMTDLITGVGVLISGLLIWYDQRFLVVDPICTLIFAGLVLHSTANIVGRVMSILFEGVPDGVDYFAIKRELEKIPGVESVHHLHIWAVSTSVNCLSCHMSVRPAFSNTGSPTIFNERNNKTGAAAAVGGGGSGRRIYSGSTVANYHTQTLMLARAVCKKGGVDNVTIQIEDAEDDCPTHDCDPHCAGPQEKV